MEQTSFEKMWSADADKAKYDDIIERLETLEYFALNMRSCVKATIEDLYPLGDALLAYAHELVCGRMAKGKKVTIKDAKIAQHIRECSEGISQITHRMVALRDNIKYLQIKEKMW